MIFINDSDESLLICGKSAFGNLIAVILLMPGKRTGHNADFKRTALEFLENDGDWNKVKKDLKKAFTCQVYLDNPQFIVSDETHFIGAYLTKAAFDEYRKAYKSHKLSESQHELFQVSDWEMELVKVDS